MALSISSGLTGVTGSVTSTQQKNSAKWANHAIQDNSTTTLATVGADKVWRILSVQINMWVNAVTGSIACNFAGVTAIKGATANLSALIQLNQRWNYDSCPVLTAGQTIQGVTTTSGATNTSFGQIGYSYIEESV